VLLVVTVKDAPAVVGVTLEGLGVQVGGGDVVPAAQLKLTAELYPFAAVSLPDKVAFWLIQADCGELLIARV
jgi:hypothetical protein